ncbi:hypothetical protein GCM10009799_22310 [Nocardiopsis rhodophaea]|uniref:Uncharacterized protein n=1 Tax=Nocardiopsis rhodophaea TaxID=280238 RepID=A0ABP5EFH7_9ACTN
MWANGTAFHDWWFVGTVLDDVSQTTAAATVLDHGGGSRSPGADSHADVGVWSQDVLGRSFSGDG